MVRALAPPCASYLRIVYIMVSRSRLLSDSHYVYNLQLQLNSHLPRRKLSIVWECRILGRQSYRVMIPCEGKFQAVSKALVW